MDDDRTADRLHIIDGLLSALDRMDEVRRVVRASADRASAKTQLMAELGMSDVQANHVLDMTVARETLLGRAELAKEAEALRSTSP